MLGMKEMQRLLAECDIERRPAGEPRVQLNLNVSPADRELIRSTARAARTTQSGILKFGLRLAARTVDELVKAGW